MSVQIDTETAALTGEQRLYAAMQEFVDPEMYFGDSCFGCLIGQVAEALFRPEFPLDEISAVAERFDVSKLTVMRIYAIASHAGYRSNFDAAMQMAAEELGLTPTGKEEPYRG